jgi:hypothetical protein
MPLPFAPGDDLVFQIESGFGLIRILARDGKADSTVWHIRVYEDFYPEVEMAEAALSHPDKLGVRSPHLALTDHALEKTPAARLGNRPVDAAELEVVEKWRESPEAVSDRSVLLLLGMR